MRKHPKAMVTIQFFPFADDGTLDVTAERIAHAAIPQPSRAAGQIGGGSERDYIVR